MVVHRRDLDAIGPQYFDDRVDLCRTQNEIAIDRCVITLQLEIEWRVHAHVARDCSTHRGYMDIVTRYVDVEHASSHTARVADNPFDFLGELGFCLRACSYWVQGGLSNRKRLPNSLRHFHLVAASDEMDVHDPRVLVEQVVVESR